MSGQLYPTRTIVFMSDQAMEDFIHSCQIIAIGKPMSIRAWRQPVYDLINDIFRFLEPTYGVTSRIVLTRDDSTFEADIAAPRIWKMNWCTEGIVMNASLTFKGRRIYIQSAWDDELKANVIVNSEGGFAIR